MPVSFWVSLTLLVLLALLFVCAPLLRRHSQRPITSRRLQNLDTYRSRLRELEQERDDGLLDESNFESLRDELELSLLQDVESGEEVPPDTGLGGRRGVVSVALTLAVLIPVLAFVIYAEFGARDALVQYRTVQNMQKGGVTQQDIESMVEGLRQRLEREPDNPQGWAMLARSYMQLGRHRQAADAYEGLAKAMDSRGEGGVASAWGLRAQALFVANSGEMTDGVREAIAKARDFNPDEVNALSLLGVAAFESGDYRRAIHRWHRILEVDPDHPQADSIRRGIGAAYMELGKSIPEHLKPSES